MGNCQCESFAACVRAALPDAIVETVHAHFLYDPAYADRVTVPLAAADLVASQIVEWPREGAVREAIIAAQPKTKLWPGFGFDGFHPDIVYLHNPEGGLIRAAMGDYNSRIIAAAFAAGRTPAETRTLFNALSYSRLGYFEAYPRACAAAKPWLAQFGIDSVPLLAAWSADGPFMHTVNHPKIQVIAAFVARLFEEAGLPVPPPMDALGDPLAGCTWPVYPEIGWRIGIEGGTEFVPGGERMMSLEEMIEESFAAYAALPTATLQALAPVQEAITALRL